MSYLTSRKRTAYWFVGTAALAVSERISRRGHLHNIVSSGRLNNYLADIDRQAAGTHGKAHRADETGAGYYGAVKGGKRFGMDTENE